MTRHARLEEPVTAILAAHTHKKNMAYGGTGGWVMVWNFPLQFFFVVVLLAMVFPLVVYTLTRPYYITELPTSLCHRLSF